jgi:hypothetical protein
LPQESTTGVLASESNVVWFFQPSRHVHHEFAPEGHTINHNIYLAILRHMDDAV